MAIVAERHKRAAYEAVHDMIAEKAAPEFQQWFSGAGPAPGVTSGRIAQAMANLEQHGCVLINR